MHAFSLKYWTIEDLSLVYATQEADLLPLTRYRVGEGELHKWLWSVRLSSVRDLLDERVIATVLVVRNLSSDVSDPVALRAVTRLIIKLLGDPSEPALETTIVRPD